MVDCCRSEADQQPAACFVMHRIDGSLRRQITSLSEPAEGLQQISHGSFAVGLGWGAGTQCCQRLVDGFVGDMPFVCRTWF